MMVRIEDEGGGDNDGGDGGLRWGRQRVTEDVDGGDEDGGEVVLSYYADTHVYVFVDLIGIDSAQVKTK